MRVVGVLLGLVALSRAAVLDNSIETEPSWLSCSDQPDTISCLGVRAVAGLDRAARMADIQILPGVTLVKEADFRAGRALLSPRELEASLPQDSEERSSRLLDLVYDSALRFLQSHSLQLKMPQDAPETFQRALDEGRAKIKKKFLPILMLVGAKLVTLLPIAIGAIGLLVLKALIVGKLAFVLAAILAFQKFFAGGVPSFGSKAPDTWSAAPATSGGPYYRRSFEAHNLAYSGQAPQPAQQQ